MNFPNLKPYFLGTCPDGGPCFTCKEPVVLHEGRWFITMNHPGFNSDENNLNGYATKEEAIQDYLRFSGNVTKPLKQYRVSTILDVDIIVEAVDEDAALDFTIKKVVIEADKTGFVGIRDVEIGYLEVVAIEEDKI